MKTHSKQPQHTAQKILFAILLVAVALTGCTAANPKLDQLQLPQEPPMARTTSFTTALSEMGTLSEIYATQLLKIQCEEIDDVTGTSYHTGGEIPKSITIMVKSALNSIGGRVVYIPFWPDYVNGIQVSGYPVSHRKLIPDVILTGGITEFDRGLASLDRSRNFDVESQPLDHLGKDVPGDTIGLDYENGNKWAMAKIAVDFNLVSYEGLYGIPKMQASNGINVYKGIREEEFGFTLLGPTIGLRGSVKKVQGRHDALRLLVQFSVIQLVGRYLDLPYWQLLDGAQPDPVVIDSIKTSYLKKDTLAKILCLQRLLWLNGHKVPISGKMDRPTQTALAALEPGYEATADPVPAELYLRLYLAVPLTPQSVTGRQQFDQALAQWQAARMQPKPQETPRETPPKPEPAPQKPGTERKTTPSGQVEQPQTPHGRTASAHQVDQAETTDGKAVSAGKVIKTKTASGKTPPSGQVDQPKAGALPMDAETREALERIIQRLEEKRKNNLSVENQDQVTLENWDPSRGQRSSTEKNSAGHIG
jgi:hypothetical protein